MAPCPLSSDGPMSPEVWSLCNSSRLTLQTLPEPWSLTVCWAGSGLWRPQPCVPVWPHRQQEEHSRQPEEPPQPQVEEQLPGSPTWALPAPTTRPGMASPRRQVGTAVTCRTLTPHQALGAPQRAQDPEDYTVLWVQCGTSDLWSLGSHACLSHTVAPPAFQKCLSS